MRVFLVLFVLLLLACSSEKEEVIPEQSSDVEDRIKTESDTTKTSANTKTPDETNNQSNLDSISFLALGDSYTIGTGEEPENRWPILFSERMAENGYHVNDLRIIARAGWTTRNLISSINNQEFPQKYELVSLLIGVNNQYQGLSFSVFEEEFMKLLSFAQETANGKKGVFVLSIPDYGVTPFGQHSEAKISAEIDQYNEYIEKVCIANDIKFYNITEISRKAKNNLSYLAPDNLHPSKKMYEDWINLIISDPPGFFDN